MNQERLIGSRSVRWVTLLLVLSCLAGVALRELSTSEMGAAFLPLMIVGAFLTFMGTIFSFAPLYALWMSFAKVLHTVSITVLFGACYLLVVPPFFVMTWILDPLRLRKRFDGPSYWIERNRGELDERSLRRMG